MNYKGIAALIAAEAEIVAKEIMDANEGFDGEIEPETLVLKVCASMAVNKWTRRGREEIEALLRTGTPARITPITPAAPKTASRGTKPCKYCGTTGLKWNNDDGRWTLMNPDGSRHTCRRDARKEEARRQSAEDVAVDMEIKRVQEETYLDQLKKV